ncbi:cytochrome P460 family protein [Rubripirellula sp.]|jgi:hypothetical protein|nr:cytochrome P460 family protein [Rubripirellula sp.]MDB4694952.1 cytochrome P460 family protein [bacterium]MDB4749562.1 cytochrome P460 family protein [Rubripirellula sp.]
MYLKRTLLNPTVFGLLLFAGCACLVFLPCLVSGDEPDAAPLALVPQGTDSKVDMQNNGLDPHQSTLANQIFAGRLMEIAAEYRQYGRMEQKMHWSPRLCFLPQEPPANRGEISASDSDTTHGKKLYFLFARKSGDYQFNVWEDETGSVKAPLGQVLVKEAWEPVLYNERSEKGLHLESATIGGVEKRPYAKLGNKRYHAGEKNGLYVMFKTAVDTPGTDQGWVYGTVSADGKRVTSVGRLQTCIQCHRNSTRDRQLGRSAER